MASPAVDGRPQRSVLTFGRVDRARITVRYQVGPEGPAYQQFLLDLPLPEADASGAQVTGYETRILAALEPLLSAGRVEPWEYALHQHCWHTSHGEAAGALGLELMLITGGMEAATFEEAKEAVRGSFGEVLADLGVPGAGPTSRDDAVRIARDAVAEAYDTDVDALALTTEEHQPDADAWTVGLRTIGADEYDVVVGLVAGYAGSLGLRHVDRSEVSDSVGSE